MKPSQLSTDSARNTLILTLTGRVTKKELDSLYTDIRFTAADMQKGYSVISDFSQCQLIYLNGLPTFRKIMHYLVTNGVGEVVRVMDSNRLISKQIVNFTMRMQGYRPIYTETLAEAKQMLDDVTKRDGLRIHLKDVQVQGRHEDSSWTGALTNISTSGCAVKSSTFFPGRGERLHLHFSLQGDDDEAKSFSLNGSVVREDARSFGVRFQDISPDTREKLWKCLIHESQRELDA